MDFFKKHKNTVIFLAIAVLFFVVYINFFAPDSASENALVSTQGGNSAAAQAAERELLSILLQLRNIELDESIFEDDLFRRLQDFSQEIVPEPSGRPNPFAPIGVGGFQGTESVGTNGAVGTQ